MTQFDPFPNVINRFTMSLSFGVISFSFYRGNAALKAKDGDAVLECYDQDILTCSSNLLLLLWRIYAYIAA
jgi:hypothetical protein